MNILIWTQYSFLFHLSHIESELMIIFLSDVVCLFTCHANKSYLCVLFRLMTLIELRLHLPFLPPVLRIRDPESSAILTPGSGKKKIRIREKHPGSFIRELSNNFLGQKYLILLRIRDPVPGDPISGAWGSGIRWWNFFTFLWAIFACLDPDPQNQLNLDPGHCQIGWNFKNHLSSVADPKPHPQGPYVFGPPGSGSGSISTRYHGSGSFYNQAKIVKKTLIPTVLWLLYDFFS